MSDSISSEKLSKLLKKWQGKKGALIMALHEVQEKHGYVPWEAAEAVSKNLDVPIAWIYEDLTFYNYFKLTPPGRVIISVCAGTACHMKKSEDLLETFKKKLEIKEGETTKDGLFYLQVVRCLGCCGLSPAILINGRVYGRVTPDDIPNILNEWRDKTTSEPGKVSS